MVDQAKMNGYERVSTLPPEEPPQGINGLLHRLVLLIELQAQLLQADVSEGLHRLVLAAALLLITAAMGFACLLVAMLFVAELLADLGLYRSAAFIIATFLGLGVTAGLAFAAVRCLRGCLQTFDRSREEWRRTVHWIKDALKNAKSSNSWHGGKG